MIKKLVYLGLALVIISVIILLYASSQQSGLASSIAQNITTTNFTIHAGGFTYLPMLVNTSSYLFLLAKMTGPSNFYLFNQKAFNIWTSKVNFNTSQGANAIRITGLSAAKSLEGNGVFLIYQNATFASIPSTSNVNYTPIYQTNQTQMFPAGTYYAVIDNTAGSASSPQPIQARILSFPPINNITASTGSFSSISNQLKSQIVTGIIFIVIFITGIILIVYGLLKKDQSEEIIPTLGKKAPDQAQIDELYRSVGKESKKKKRTN